MRPWQRCNHLPGIYNLAKKNMLGKHLTKMQKDFPSEYNFFPRTWILPQDIKEFTADGAFGTPEKPKTFIVKPDGGCQGKGIFMCQRVEQLLKPAHGGGTGGTQRKDEDLVYSGQVLEKYVV
jgi:tubulin polyglutamylase TTLL6/13